MQKGAEYKQKRLTLQAAFRAGQVPKEYNGGLITTVFKKGASLDTSNYRPITVTDSLMRLYAGILNARLLAYTEAQGLRAETQTGFRPGYSTVNQLFALQHCIDEQFGAIQGYRCQFVLFT